MTPEERELLNDLHRERARADALTSLVRSLLVGAALCYGYWVLAPYLPGYIPPDARPWAAAHGLIENPAYDP